MIAQTKIITFPTEQSSYSYRREDRRFYSRKAEYPERTHESTLQLIVHGYNSVGLNIMTEKDENVGLQSYLVHGLGGFMGKIDHDKLARIGRKYRELWLSKFALPQYATPVTQADLISQNNHMSAHQWD